VEGGDVRDHGARARCSTADASHRSGAFALLEARRRSKNGADVEKRSSGTGESPGATLRCLFGGGFEAPDPALPV
jgi:hypothetical protein